VIAFRALEKGDDQNQCGTSAFSLVRCFTKEMVPHLEYEMLRSLVDLAHWQTIAARNVAQLPRCVESLIEIAKFSDRINEIDKNFQGSILNIVALFSDFSLVLLPTVSGGLSKLEGILEADGIGIVLQNYLWISIPQRPESAGVSWEMPASSNIIFPYVVPNSSITDAGSIPSPFFLLVFAAVAGLRLPDKLALAEEDIMNK
jgi:hypothetical protein